jgi:O-antigen/teichoic acid export membrane protein
MAPRVTQALRVHVSERRTAFANSLYKAASIPVEKGSRVVLMLAAAPALGAAAFGSYQFAATLTTFLMLCTEMGLGVWTTRTLARDRSRAAVLVGTALRMRGLAVVPYLVAMAVVVAALVPGDLRVAIIFLAPIAIGNAVVDYAATVFRGFERFQDEAVLNVVRALLTMGAGLGALALSPTVGGLGAAVLAGTSVSAGAAFLLFAKRYRLVGRGAGSRFDRDVARAALAQGIPLWMVTLISLLYFRGDVLLMRIFVGDAEIGAYSAAYKIFEGAGILPGVILAGAFPPLARAHGDPARQRRWERLLVVMLLALGAAAGAALYAGDARIIALVFGRGYQRALPSLRILSLAVPLLYLNGALTSILIARDLERRNLLLAVLMLVVNTGANLILIPRLGGPGAAWATLLTEAALTLCCLVVLGVPRFQAARVSGA